MASFSTQQRHVINVSSDSESIYVMSDYFDVPILKDLCKSAFIAMLHPGNVLLEMAHRFGRLHEPIAEALLSYAVENWVNETSMLQTRNIALLTT